MSETVTIFDMFNADFKALKETSGEVGIEIEVEGNNLYKGRLRSWRVEADGSLRGEDNAEYVLKKPVSRVKIKEVLEELREALEYNNSNVDNLSPRTSVHVHINCQKLTPRQMFTFFCLYQMFEDLLVKFCGKEREGNLFCLRSKDAQYLLETIESGLDNGIILKIDKDLRYSAINMAAIQKYGSIEFRSMRGILDVELINLWVNMLLHIKDKSMEYRIPRDILMNMSALGSERFFHNVMGEYSEYLQCPNMSGLINESMRRIQPIAFHPMICNDELYEGYLNRYRDLIVKKKIEEKYEGGFVPIQLSDGVFYLIEFNTLLNHPETLIISHYNSNKKKLHVYDPHNNEENIMPTEEFYSFRNKYYPHLIKRMDRVEKEPVKVMPPLNKVVPEIHYQNRNPLFQIIEEEGEE